MASASGIETYLSHRRRREENRREQAALLEAALQRQLQQAETLAEMTQRVLKGKQVEDLVEELCSATADALGTERAAVFELRPERQDLVLRAGVGWPPDAFEEGSLDASEGSQAGHTVRTWEPTVVDDLQADDRFRPPQLLVDEGIRSGVTVVVPGPDDPWGIFGVHDREAGAFDEQDTTFVQSMCHVLSHAVLRERAQRQIEREEELFASLVRELDEYAIFTCDPDGHVRSWNRGAERIKGYREEEILGEHFSVFYPEEDRRAGIPERNLEKAAERGSFRDEGWRVREDGSRYWADVTITPLHDAEGELRGFAKVTRDVTERRERERQLEASNERLEHFAYAASHDLKEPLRMVSSYLQLVADRYADELGEEGTELLDQAEDGARRMHEMIDSLLAYARVRTEGRPMRPVDAQGVLEDALADLELQIEETDAEITLGELPRVRADPDQLAQVFRNLLSNALKYSGDERPRVHVDAHPEDTGWRFTVTDEGVGIPADGIDEVFEVFGRLSEEESGTGIGLAICEQIVERHGGDMWVESEPGEGSTFSFTLPEADGRGPVRREDEPAQPPPLGG